ncbi:ATP-binding protein [Dictyobacter kobayashii]|uniref:Heat-shock protein n=1 Tax=Dictyobacter kobayashii TaxID=2014872 RepID=A0A402ARJ5_9CHLR|nr:ATP-binding protein [Dictyobacter kobayashii]GCE21683.1 heat-shock protein [Dictyobacter kobayashii]
MPEELEILPVDIHLPGLLKVLGEHLYSDPRVAIRELIQNAHDSCVRRRQEDADVAEEYAPEITVSIDSANQQLSIEDNGSGLTHDEITVFLATVGRGYTRELRERLGNAQREEALDLIGMFGLGLLSAFMIASRIEITTSSYQSPGEAWRWISDGGQSYALRKASRESIGTTVRLDLREDAKFLLDASILRSVLKTYAAFLPIPIYVGEDAIPINNSPAPWLLDSEASGARFGQTARYLSWIEERTELRPLSVLPLSDVQAEDGTVIPLRGVLFVPPRSIVSIQEYGDITVYVRHMLITERERDLLPAWARFVSGIVDCPALNPTASRETLRHDELFAAVQTALEKALLAHFEDLADHAPLDWQAIVQAHNDLIKGWSVRAPELFTRVADLVSFKTSRGELTLPAYLRENPGRIFYYDNEDGVTQALALFEARRLAVIDARWFADTAFLKAYGQVYGVPVEELTPSASYLFSPVEDPEQRWQALIEACRAEGFPVRLLAYEPEHLPMILLYPAGAQKVRRAQHNMDEGRFVGPIRSLVRGFLERQQTDEAVMKGVLHLNVRNPLLRRIRDMGPEHPNFTALLSILVANARMFAGQNLSAQDAIACFEQINTSLSSIAGLTQQIPAGHHTLTAAMLTTIGLHPEAAGRLSAEYETVEALLAANTQQVAERLHISPLLLATVCEELKRQPDEEPAADARSASTLLSLTDARHMRNIRASEENTNDAE